MKLEESDMPESDSVPSLFERRNGRRKAIKTRATSEELVKQENENDKVEELNEANMFASSAGRVFRFSGK